MLVRDDLQQWVEDALKDYGGKARLVDVAKHNWDNHEKDLRRSKLLYTWQYDMRWGATKLRHKGRMKPVKDSPRGVWQLH